jgi:hypothetical protein
MWLGSLIMTWVLHCILIALGLCVGSNAVYGCQECCSLNREHHFSDLKKLEHFKHFIHCIWLSEIS